MSGPLRRVSLLLLALMSALGVTANVDAAGPGRALIEAAELRAMLGDGVVVLDARPEKRYAAGRVPGARPIDVNAWRELFAAAPEAAGAALGELGVTPGATVVVYDDEVTPRAARPWWLLRYWGVDNAAVLNGGWKAWTAAGGETETGAPPAVAAAEPFPVAPRAGRLVTLEQLRDAMAGEATPQLVDVRTSREFDGGCIGSAASLDWEKLVDGETGRLLPADELRARFEAAGIDLARPAVTYCKTGGRASVGVLALEALGAADAASFYGGWTEWSAGGGER